MTTIDKFLRTIEIANQPMVGKQAYKMDDESKHENSMRRFVDLGTCRCCDYFIPQKNEVALIEETQLKRSKEYYRNKYKYLNNEDKEIFSNQQVRDEMRLKVYGSMFILCRLVTYSSKAKKILRGKKFVFWLVASGLREEEIIAYDNIKDGLLNGLKGAFGSVVFSNVEIITSKELRKRIP